MLIFYAGCQGLFVVYFCEVTWKFVCVECQEGYAILSASIKEQLESANDMEKFLI